MKLASRGRNTIEKLSIPAIRINTNQACVFWLHDAHETWRSLCVSEGGAVCVWVLDEGGILIKDAFSTAWGGIVFACNDCCGGGARNTLATPPVSSNVNYIKGSSHCVNGILLSITPPLPLVPTPACETEGWKTEPANHALNVTKIIRWYGGGVRYSLCKLLGVFLLLNCALWTPDISYLLLQNHRQLCYLWKKWSQQCK